MRNGAFWDFWHVKNLPEHHVEAITPLVRTFPKQVLILFLYE